MDFHSLMTLPIDQRTDFLEERAHRQGLKTAPGARHEGQVLSGILEQAAIRQDLGEEQLPRSLWSFYLKAPLALIRMLELFHPELLKLDRPLQILYLGAGRDECVDEGRWLSVAWKFQGIQAPPPQVVAVGPELVDEARWPRSQWRDLLKDVPEASTRLAGRLEDHMVKDGRCIAWDEYFDIAVMHHPRFANTLESWFMDAAWRDLAGGGALPIIGTSHDPTDFQFDRQGMAACGRSIDQAWWNPTAHIAPVDGKHAGTWATRLQWGAVLWSSRRPGAGVRDAEARQKAALEWFETHLPPLILEQRPLTQLLRWHTCCPMQFDLGHEHLIVADDLRINVRTGVVEAFGQTLEPGPVAMQVLGRARAEDRLALGPDLLDEIQGGLDMAAATAAMRDSPAPVPTPIAATRPTREEIDAAGEALAEKIRREGIHGNEEELSRLVARVREYEAS